MSEHHQPLQGTIRKLWPAESNAFRDHLLRLDRDSRRLRFAHSVSDAFIDDYAARMNDMGSIVFALASALDVEQAVALSIMLAMLVPSKRFFYRKSSMRAKVKTPYELVASTYRVLLGAPDTAGRSIQLSAQLGQQLYGHQTPDGWPDDAQSWMNTGAVLARINFGTNVAAGRIPGIAIARWEPALHLRGVPLAEQVDGIAAAVFQGEVSPDTRAVLMTGSNPLAARANGTTDTRAPTLNDLIGLALGAPEFQRH